MEKKKVLVLGTGTAGLITAITIKNRFKDKVDVTVYYNGDQKNIGVGEGTLPGFVGFVREELGLTAPEFLYKFNSSLKLGINFKDWIPGEEFFHGFSSTSQQQNDQRRFYSGYLNLPSSTYSLIRDKYDGGIFYNESTNTIPGEDYNNYGFGFHIDSQDLSDKMTEIAVVRGIAFVNDIAEEVFTDNKNIKEIRFKKSGIINADLYIDASGISKTLISKLTDSWVDTSDILPIDRAIPQQVFKEFTEIPSYTLAQATDCGWIWEIPVKNRFGTGFIYSSKFTSDQEAKEKFDKWLYLKHGVNLTNDRVIKFDPGYYKSSWTGNCLSVGLASGFLEPLEATGLMFITLQSDIFCKLNPTLNTDLGIIQKKFNSIIEEYYITALEVIRLHYNTGRVDSEFWRYMENNKPDFLLNLIEVAKHELLVKNHLTNYNIFSVDSYIAIMHGLKMLNINAIKKYIKSHNKPFSLLKRLILWGREISSNKKAATYISHKKYLDSLKPRRVDIFT
jgi:tryptophan halogenase